MKAQAIDDVDRKILRILQHQGRASVREISDRIGNLTKVAIAYRMKRLIKIGAIEGFFTRINPDRLGQSFLFIAGLSIGPKGPTEKLIVKKIAAIEGVQSVYMTFGDYDALVIGRAANATEARNLLYQICRINGVQDSTTIIAHTVIKQTLDVTI